MVAGSGQCNLDCIIIKFWKETSGSGDRVSGYMVRNGFANDYIHILLSILEVVPVGFRAKILLEAVWHSGEGAGFGT